jgi:hypothetical protein
MNMKRFAVAALVGGITMWGVGYLIWGLVFADFFAANAGSATGVARDATLQWAIALGSLFLAVLITLAVSGAGGSSVGEGFKLGATVGFLVWFGVDFISYGVTNIWNLTATIADSLLGVVLSGIGGAVIAVVLGRNGQPGAREEGVGQTGIQP